MDWIEKLLFYKEDLLVLGFHAVCESLAFMMCALYLTIILVKGQHGAA